MITVCIATYNGSRYIRQQLLSILPQLAETDEIVVSDDGSTDDTSEIVRSIGDKRIRIVDNRKGEGGKHYHKEKDGKHYHKEDRECGISPRTIKYASYGGKLYPYGLCEVKIS